MKLNFFTPIKCLTGFLVLALLFAPAVNASIRFLPYMNVGAEFSDNVELAPADPETNFTTTIGPGFDLVMEGRRSRVSLNYEPTYAAYVQSPEYSTLRHDAALLASVEISNTTRLEFGNSHLYTEDPFSELPGDTVAELPESTRPTIDTTVRRGREPYATNRADLRLINQFGPDNSIELGCIYYSLDNRDMAVEDNEYYEPGILLRYWILPNRLGTEWEFRYTSRYYDISADSEDALGRVRLTRRFGRHYDLFVEYTHEYTRYLQPGEEDYQVLRPEIGFAWDEQADYSLSLSCGYFHQDNEISEDENGAVASVDAGYQWGVDSAIGFSGEIGYERVVSGAENLGFSTFYAFEITADRRLSRQMTADMLAGFRRSIYSDIEPEREDDLWRVTAGVAYQALPWMAVDLEYAFRKLKSNIELNNYTENRGTISITLRPRRPLLLDQ